MERTYLAIDLKSFYASVECRERDLDPLTTNLVVADASRTEKTICLAVSPSLKAHGIPGRPRLFEVVQKVREVNWKRERNAPFHRLTAFSYDDRELMADPSKKLDYIIAVPRMSLYMKYSTDIYRIYLNYIAPEDIHVYSIDEVFMDVTDYLHNYQMTAHELARTIIRDILKHTGITATAGIGTNLFLAKVAMDIVAKHTEADQDGVRIAELDEISYRKLLWDHRPLTDFWRVGRGYTKKLEENGLFTMGDIAIQSLRDEDFLFRLFGINAELLIDHAWGYEPCTMAHIKAYKPASNSIGSGQVLSSPYSFDKALIVVKEMTDSLALSLVQKQLATPLVVLTISYDSENLSGHDNRYSGEIKQDYYGRNVPKGVHGSVKLEQPTSSGRIITKGVVDLYRRIVNPQLTIRRISVTACELIPDSEVKQRTVVEQIDLFSEPKPVRDIEAEQKALQKEKKVQEALIAIKEKYGKNAVMKGIDLEEGATAIERNNQIGGHRA